VEDFPDHVKFRRRLLVKICVWVTWLRVSAIYRTCIRHLWIEFRTT